MCDNVHLVISCVQASGGQYIKVISSEYCLLQRFCSYFCWTSRPYFSELNNMHKLVQHRRKYMLLNMKCISSIIILIQRKKTIMPQKVLYKYTDACSQSLWESPYAHSCHSQKLSAISVNLLAIYCCLTTYKINYEATDHQERMWSNRKKCNAFEFEVHQLHNHIHLK